MERSYSAGQHMNGLIYLHPIISNRERGSEIRNLHMFKKLCGANNFRNVVLGLTFCDQEQEGIILRRQRQLTETPEWWGDMIARGSQVGRVFLEPEDCLQLLSHFAPQALFTYGTNNPYVGLGYSNSSTADSTTGALGKITLKIQSEIFDQGISINDTEAAQTIVHKKELDEIRSRERRELAAINAEFKRRMDTAGKAYARKMTLMAQKFEAIRKRQELQDQTLRVQAELNEELEKKERLLRDEERVREEAQANELRRLEEQLKSIRIENEQRATRVRTQQEFAKIRPRLKERWQRLIVGKETFQDWKLAGSTHQIYYTWLADVKEQVDVDMALEIQCYFCEACLRSVDLSETNHSEFC